MSVSTRTRFEVFKRDDFTCRYCGQRSPEVVLEVDHIVPLCDGGKDDPVNLATSCWDCNRGKAGMPLHDVMTGEDPHDRAILMLEQERQLRELNTVLEMERARRESETWELVAYWNTEQGIKDPDKIESIGRQDYYWLMHTLKWCPKEVIREFMDVALRRGLWRNLKYVGACVRNWRAERGLDPVTEP